MTLICVLDDGRDVARSINHFLYVGVFVGADTLVDYYGATKCGNCESVDTQDCLADGIYAPASDCLLKTNQK